jgi:2-hydroxychromene-2-carboxylate isomerase
LAIQHFLKNLVNDLNLSWDEIKKDLGKKEWKKILDDNLKEMYDGNCWGVPSFKVTGENDENPFYQWGQDRIWLIEEEIIKRLN